MPLDACQIVYDVLDVPRDYDRSPQIAVYFAPTVLCRVPRSKLFD